MRGTPLDHRCGRVAKLALERRRVQWHCPWAPTAKGADPRTDTPLRRNVFLPWCPVSSLSWPACAGAFLVPGRWFSGPAPSGSSLFFVPPLFWPRASRSSTRREGRRVKRRGTDPRTGPFWVPLYVRRPGVRPFSSSWRCLLYFIIGGFGLPPLAQTFSSL